MREQKEINRRIGANIQRARESAGLTQDRLSEQIGVTPKHVSAIERGIYGISLETLEKLCAVLEVSADYLLFQNSPDKEEQLLASRLARVEPKYKQRVLRGVDVLLSLAEREK